jgi:hypothetical protein
MAVVAVILVLAAAGAQWALSRAVLRTIIDDRHLGPGRERSGGAGRQLGRSYAGNWEAAHVGPLGPLSARDRAQKARHVGPWRDP